MKLGVFALLAAAAIPAVAQVPQVQDRADRHARAETRAEVPGQVRSLFARLDVNRDGFVARDEAQAGRKALRERLRGERLHGANDPARQQRRVHDRMAAFDRMDSDRNGVISRNEFAQGQVVRQQRRAVRLDRGQRGGGRSVGALRGHMFDLADVNRDNRVSIEEATNAALQHFDRADLNRDGQLTREERRQGRQRLRSERRRG